MTPTNKGRDQPGEMALITDPSSAGQSWDLCLLGPLENSDGNDHPYSPESPIGEDVSSQPESKEEAGGDKKTLRASPKKALPHARSQPKRFYSDIFLEPQLDVHNQKRN